MWADPQQVPPWEWRKSKKFGVSRETIDPDDLTRVSETP